MKVLIVGSGGREHAIAWKVAQSKKVDKIYCAPGNAGISEVAECVPIGAMEFDKLVAFAKEKEIDLTVIGMDDPLVGGIVDVFEKEGLRVFGPRKNAAILEGSKAFSKDLMKKYNIPTAAYETFTDPEKALEYLETAKMPIVLKADGLALGKGVLICQTLEEAKEGVKTLMMDKKFGSAGDEIVIEEFMTGREVSVLSFVDGNIVKIMSSAQDHKRAKDGDQGLNTGGMGNFSPSPFYTKEVDEFCKKYIYQATVDAMKAEGWEFASHTWGHMNATERSAEDLKTDDEKWKANVAPILGDTDMIIFAFGADIGDWEGYSSDNPKFQYYKSAGYDYFCNVDSSQYFVQITDQYFRQGRRNLDGYRMYYNPDMLSDLFDVSEVWDSSRPTPVPEM